VDLFGGKDCTVVGTLNIVTKLHH